ncbi:MAG: branched-chain amino acid ABC transporter permease, partial [Rhodoglobus sp.]|nr:branched-chain amino acid ABC transporter permease [Rhodoglobus sp.]
LSLLFAALALSYNLLFGTAGMLSFGHALYFAMGAYGLGIMLENSDLSLVPAMGLTLALVVVAAYLIGALSMRVTGIAFAMVTLAFAQAGNVLVRRNPSITGGDEGLRLATENVPEMLVGVVNTRNLYWVALALVVVVFAIVTWFEHSRAGHVVAATRENELRVRVIGLRPFIVKLITFVIASALAALVGMVYLLLQSGATPGATSANFTLTILVIVVLGGVGSRWGAVVGGIVYTLLDQRLTAFASSDVVAGLPDLLRIPLSEPLFILGTLFILVVLFLPGGIAGFVGRLGDRARSRIATRDRLEEAS